MPFHVSKGEMFCPHSLILESLPAASSKLQLLVRRVQQHYDDVESKHLHGHRHWFEPTINEDAGLTDSIWHCNRHTFASTLVMAGQIRSRKTC